MSYYRFGLVMALSIIFSSATVQLLGQQSKSASFFAPTFSPDFEEVLVESPLEGLPSNVADRSPKRANFLQVAIALPTESAGEAGCATEECLTTAPRESLAICTGGSKLETGPCCQACRPKSAEDMKSHCQLMAKLLAIAIQDQEQSNDARRQVIEAALMMIAETSEAKAQLKIAKLEATHQKQLSELRSELKKSNSPPSSVSQIREWLGPVYTNQNRNFHQLQTMAADNQSLSQKVGLLERKIDAVNQSLPPRTIHNRLYGESLSARSKNHGQAEATGPPHQRDQKDWGQPNRISPSEQARRLRQEIHDLQNRLKVLQQEAVRPANHLEPVFNPDQPLRPLYNR